MYYAVKEYQDNSWVYTSTFSEKAKAFSYKKLADSNESKQFPLVDSKVVKISESFAKTMINLCGHTVK